MAKDVVKYNRIKATLALKDRTSKELAEHLKINAQTVSSWCTNSRQPRLDELYAIADFLDVEPIILLEPRTKS
ncbi:helix-turn-helix transcriptional regulator [Filimonas lacunae]|nr:helix-turn-helix transcriptional regulator [Filimonas lacunae]BAV06523.1 hypothetical protein FLA_2542 [Filimonas lacunae]